MPCYPRHPAGWSETERKPNAWHLAGHTVFVRARRTDAFGSLPAGNRATPHQGIAVFRSAYTASVERPETPCGLLEPRPSRRGVCEPVDVPGKRRDIDLSPGYGQNCDW